MIAAFPISSALGEAGDQSLNEAPISYPELLRMADDAKIGSIKIPIYGGLARGQRTDGEDFTEKILKS